MTTSIVEHPKAPSTVPTLKGTDGGRILSTSLIFGITGLVLFVILALTGITMRMAQAEWINLEPTWFYRLMTLHGAGMFVAVLMSMMGCVFYALSPLVKISRASMAWSYLLVLGGAVLVIIAVFFGGFAGGWTFLFPLPFLSQGGWATWTALTFLAGLILVSLGWGVFFYEMMQLVTARFGSIWKASGLSYLFGKSDTPPPASIVGVTVVSFVALTVNMVGAAIVIASLVYGLDNETKLDMLWAKNTTYSFGHTIMNLLIYMAAVLLYAVVPRYTGRAWKATKPFVSAWMLSLFAVSAAYTHHLYMDFVNPGWAHALGQIASSLAAIPVAVITVYTALLLTWGSRYRWTLASALIYLGFAGWLTGGIAAVADSLIAVNARFHNTVWVPAHFHSYLLLGVMLWAIAFVVHLLERSAGRPVNPGMAKLITAMIILGGYTLVGMWYISGALGTPRRWALQPDGAQIPSAIASVGAIVLVLGVLLCLAQMVVLGKEAAKRRKSGAANDTALDYEGEPASAALAEAVDETDFISPYGSWVKGFKGLAFALIALVIGLSPQLKEWSENSIASHHVVHAIQFGAGGIVGLWFGSTTLLLGTLRRMPRSMAALLVMLFQALMMAMMAPAIYRAVEETNLLHLTFHLGIVILGILMGLAATRFTHFISWFSVALGIFGALLWAPGVS